MAKFPLAYNPNTVWEYGRSIEILGRVIEIASNKTLDVFLKICNSNHFHYEGAKVLTSNGGQSLDTNIRNVKTSCIGLLNNLKLSSPLSGNVLLVL